MRVAGWVIVTCGVVLTVLGWFWPVNISELGFSGTCGPAAFAVLPQSSQSAEVAECRQSAESRILAVTVAGVAAAFCGSMMAWSGARDERRQGY